MWLADYSRVKLRRDVRKHNYDIDRGIDYDNGVKVLTISSKCDFTVKTLKTRINNTFSFQCSAVYFKWFFVLLTLLWFRIIDSLR